MKVRGGNRLLLPVSGYAYAPKSPSSLLTFNTLPPISYDNCWFLFPMMCITEHFSRLKSICSFCDHVNILLRSPAVYPLKVFPHHPLHCIVLCHLQR